MITVQNYANLNFVTYSFVYIRTGTGGEHGAKGAA
jgi:hypothetical protein